MCIFYIAFSVLLGALVAGVLIGRWIDKHILGGGQR